MTVRQAAASLGYEVFGSKADREISGVFCCDLLSLCMARVPADSAWVTVMANVNVIAVASLADAACAVIAEGFVPDADTIAKAEQRGVAILCSKDPVFVTAKAIDSMLTSAV